MTRGPSTRWAEPEAHLNVWANPQETCIQTKRLVCFLKGPHSCFPQPLLFFQKPYFLPGFLSSFVSHEDSPSLLINPRVESEPQWLSQVEHPLQPVVLTALVSTFTTFREALSLTVAHSSLAEVLSTASLDC